MVSIADFEPYLKQYYNSYSPYNVTYKAGPFYAMMNKATKAGGKNMPVPQQYGNPQSTSSTFSTALGQASNSSQLAEFLIPSYPKMYSVVDIDEDLIAASRSDEFTFQRALVNTIDSALREHAKKLAIYMLGDGSGAIGQVTTSGVSGTVVTLTSATDAQRFSVGQSIYTTDTKFSTEPTNAQTVTAVDSVAGTITFGTLPTGTTDDWYLFNEGDYATSLGDKIVGFQGWVPRSMSAPWSTLFSTTRSANPTLLGGVRLDASSMTPKQALIQLVQNMISNGASPSSSYKCFVHPILYAVLVQELESSRVYTYKDTMIGGTNVSYRGISFIGAGYDIEIYQDIWCDSDAMIVVDFDKWYFENTRHAAMMTSDGLDLQRVYNADSVQLRIRTYGQVSCAAVAWNGIAYGLSTSL